MTTNRRLDGTMTCVVTKLGDQQWRGHFYGVWQEVPFSYEGTFRGPVEKLTGNAVIDGAEYAWTGMMGGNETSGWFKGAFGGDRYIGHFDLKRKKNHGKRGSDR